MDINLNAFEVVFKARSEAVQVLLDAWRQVCVNLKKKEKEIVVLNATLGSRSECRIQSTKFSFYQSVECRCIPLI